MCYLKVKVMILRFVPFRSNAQLPSYFLCVCVRTWQSLTCIHEVTVNLTLHI